MERLVWSRCNVSMSLLDDAVECNYPAMVDLFIFNSKRSCRRYTTLSSDAYVIRTTLCPITLSCIIRLSRAEAQHPKAELCTVWRGYSEAMIPSINH